MVKREPTNAEMELWRHATRHVAPSPGKEVAHTPAKPPLEQALEPKPVRNFPSSVQPRKHQAKEHAPAAFDRRTLQRLRRGQIRYDSRLDLHGLTQEAAFQRLTGFIDQSWRAGHRVVLVITGRGDGDRGVLKTMTPRWLSASPNARHVLAFAGAAVAHGGSGALYVQLRRYRSQR